jgi:hypothetical protein
MAVPAGLVTKLAEVDLENSDPGRVERVEAGVAQLCVERRTGGAVGENLELPSRGCEGILSFEERERHAASRGRADGSD